MSLRKLINQTISYIATTISLYFDSAAGLEIVCCFLDFLWLIFEYEGI